VTGLDVMVLESDQDTASAAIHQLQLAGHRVHRCHEPGLPAFPCNGLADDRTCPLAGHVDVALLVRAHVRPSPTPLEDGVGCAIRAGVPIVEEGPDVFDPFAPWVIERVDDDVVAACESAAVRRFEPLVREIRDRVDLMLARRGLDASSVSCEVEHDGTRLCVTLRGSGLGEALRQALAVRVLDGVRAGGTTVGNVDVAFEDDRAR
jgi:hypothetical protein